MTQPEKEVLARVYRVINAITGLGPTNPMDVAGMVQGMRSCRAASGPLLFAVSHLGYGELTDARRELDEAYRALGIEVPENQPTQRATEHAQSTNDVAEPNHG